MFRWFHRHVEWTAAEARKRIWEGNIPRRLRVRDVVDLSASTWLTYLPRELECTALIVSRCPNLRCLPERLECDELFMRRTNLRCISAGLDVLRRIDAEGCRGLEHVVPLRVDHLSLRGCTAIERLPEGLNVRRLELSGCSRLAELPVSITARVENLDVSDCPRLKHIPEGFERLHVLNVRGCSNLESLPDGIRIRSSIELADSGLRSLPWSLRSVRILWHGVQVPDRVAFNPESLTVDEILRESNLTMRRILLERVGMEWFLERTDAKIVDRDRDAGGDRRLLRIAFPNGEDVVCLEVRCPSTSSRYVLRVPPRTASCADAAAWMAGYSNSANYRPVAET
jgi:hypothetical protein